MKVHMLFLFVLGFFSNNPDISPIKGFEAVPSEYVFSPHHMRFAPSGRLFIIDAANARVFVWDENGNFDREFGKQGQGPGEMIYPWTLAVTENRLIVWDVMNRINIFDHEGNHIRLLTTAVNNPKEILPLSDKLILHTHRRSESGEAFVQFKLMDWGGKAGELVKEFQDKSALKTTKEQNRSTTKAFAPDVDIVLDAQGNRYFGFGQEDSIFQVDEKGKILKKITFDFPRQPITDIDEEYIKSMTFPNPRGGGRGSLGATSRISSSAFPAIRAIIPNSRSKAIRPCSS